ncbi:peptidase M28 [Arachidicoccus ginsenosidimutans]|uniref:M20/M25/M40 family metallo-hydrolase n=1 Tax=Arachidicoccus sp. BS20 TaxID=1850526 RepID=UPI0007F0C2F9|nr:M28 family metallopeptidase [Arachidicoccus sp. BS20]ANI88514.1 peptidase M28 [Arachidicoccus sp. BS20]
MKKFSFLLFCVAFCNCLFAQTIIQHDAEIEQMVQQVNADSLQSYIKSLVAFGTRSTLSNQTSATKGIGAARNWVLGKFNSFAKQSGGRLSAYIDTFTVPSDGKRINRNVVLGNVMAVLKGTDTADRRIFIISGHLDSRRTDVMDSTNDAPGANDDGSGSAAVIECARIMSKHRFPATIIFVTVSGEEQGLFGSHHLAERAKKENWNVEAMLNNDIVGSNNSNETNIINNTQVRVFSEGIPANASEREIRIIRQLGLENDSKSRELARYVKETGERYVDNLEVKLIYRIDRFLRSGDHVPFLDNGFTAVRITEMNENFNHQHQDVRKENGIQYGDLTEFVDFDYLRKNTALNLCNLANLAKAPSVPTDVSVEVRKLTNSTLLSWKAPKTGNVKGYYVLMRETSSAVWQKKIFTTSTSIELPYSKDNYFFAVQSVNESGNESLPVVPMPGR